MPDLGRDLPERIHAICLQHGVKDMSPFAAKQIAKEILTSLANEAQTKIAAEPAAFPKLSTKLQPAKTMVEHVFAQIHAMTSSQEYLPPGLYSSLTYGGGVANLNTPAEQIGSQVAMPLDYLNHGNTNAIMHMAEDLAYGLANELHKGGRILLTIPQVSTKTVLDSHAASFKATALVGYPAVHPAPFLGYSAPPNGDYGLYSSKNLNTGF